jgi:hypothetical protein
VAGADVFGALPEPIGVIAGIGAVSAPQLRSPTMSTAAENRLTSLLPFVQGDGPLIGRSALTGCACQSTKAAANRLTQARRMRRNPGPSIACLATASRGREPTKRRRWGDYRGW